MRPSDSHLLIADGDATRSIGGEGGAPPARALCAAWPVLSKNHVEDVAVDRMVGRQAGTRRAVLDRRGRLATSRRHFCRSGPPAQLHRRRSAEMLALSRSPAHRNGAHIENRRSEPWADTGTSTGRLMLAVLDGLAGVDGCAEIPLPADFRRRHVDFCNCSPRIRWDEDGSSGKGSLEGLEG
jgi:hypothetical protein